VARVRRLCESGLLAERPRWLEWCERVPPMENHSLRLQSKTVRNPYPQMVNHLLKKYPDLRFQDCYVDGNDWSVGNDTYRDDHPVMQFVARQLDFMRTEGLSKKEAFARTEELFRERRRHLEREQKVMMALAMDSGLAPMFTTGRAYLQAERANNEAAHLSTIRKQLRMLKWEAMERKERQQQQQQQQAQAEAGKEAEQATLSFKERCRKEAADRRTEWEQKRRELVGRTAEEAPETTPTPQEEASLARPTEEEGLDSLQRVPTEKEEEEEAMVATPSPTFRESPPRRAGDDSEAKVPKSAPPPLESTQRPAEDDIVIKPRTRSVGRMLGMKDDFVLGEDRDQDGDNELVRARREERQRHGFQDPDGDDGERGTGGRGG